MNDGLVDAEMGGTVSLKPLPIRRSSNTKVTVCIERSCTKKNSIYDLICFEKNVIK
jgi:hypothetical protein